MRTAPRLLVLCSTLAAAAQARPSAPPAPPAGVEATDVWTSGLDGYYTYRIPSLIVTAKGALVAFCEGRRQGRGDSGDIDLLLKRSDDGGRTWGPQRVVWDDGPNTCGNPCPVLDRETGTICLLLTHNLGEDTEAEIVEGKSRGTRTVWASRSDDDGLTWSPPREITSRVKQKGWTWYATGPGSGIQLSRGTHRGRLVVPCDHIELGKFYSHAIYSDDHGATWGLGGTCPVDRNNECQAVELPDGRILLNMRNYDRSKRRRGVCISDDGGLTWKDFRHDEALLEPVCQASLVRRTWPEPGAPGGILFSNPASESGRVRMTVRLSLDDGKTWPRSRLLHGGPSAYSSLAVARDGTIACLFECGEKGPYERIRIARLPVESMSSP